MVSGVDLFRLDVPDIFEQWAGPMQRPERAPFEPRFTSFRGSLPSPAASSVRTESSGLLDGARGGSAYAAHLQQGPSSEDGKESEPPSQLPSPPYLQPLDFNPSRSETLPAPFAFSVDPHPASYDFQVPAPIVVLSLRPKRRRAKNDVDGYNTALLGCKKRRLRSELITSRLSQPFSLPATHIINREAIAAGDKRFMKLAASANASKRCPSTHSSMMRRAALLNSTRLRVQGELQERERGFLSVAAQQSTLLHRGHQSSTGGRFLAVAAPSGSAVASTRVVLVHGDGAHGTGGPSQPSGLNVAETVARRLTKSPRLRPARSPILGPSDSRLDEVADDDETAFPEDDRRYASADDDDTEDVYSDFGAIFGVAGREDDPLDSEESSYEEYLDELDGISWVGR